MRTEIINLVIVGVQLDYSEFTERFMAIITRQQKEAAEGALGREYISSIVH